ncbi:hypothetical protein IQ16_06848 [Bradyrhizobium huanghuaihaiense]|uniref:Uncharacterized protein n=1 Tax=Bradyrhizobium huanghuaihaiense TaxID=990078 RepID=A0A562R090_9BRAD|nr:hypothetical protein IQ16_06848 [Bradyrhizobium huanghuaihaiense]
MALQPRADRRIGPPPKGVGSAVACVTLPGAVSNVQGAPTGTGTRFPWPVRSSFSAVGLMQLVGNLRPGHAAVLQLPFGHGLELASGPGPLPPDTHEIHQRPPKPHEHHRL